MPSGEKLAINNALYGLQQLRTVIPERLWMEEFALVIDKREFEEIASRISDVPLQDPVYPPTVGLGSTEYYFLYAATTGETIRLDDRYLQFLDSPYWNTPEAVRKLYYLQHNHMKVAR
jgi:hypothetical protein